MRDIHLASSPVSSLSIDIIAPLPYFSTFLSYSATIILEHLRAIYTMIFVENTIFIIYAKMTALHGACQRSHGRVSLLGGTLEKTPNGRTSSSPSSSPEPPQTLLFLFTQVILLLIPSIASTLFSTTWRISWWLTRTQTLTDLHSALRLATKWLAASPHPEISFPEYPSSLPHKVLPYDPFASHITFHCSFISSSWLSSGLPQYSGPMKRPQSL